MYYALILIAGVMLLLVQLLSNRKPKHNYLSNAKKAKFVSSMSTNNQAVDLLALTDKTRWQRFKDKLKIIQKQLGDNALVKFIVAVGVLAAIGNIFNDSFLRINPAFAIALSEIIGISYLFIWLQQREEKHFEEHFPDALNMLASAVSAGESIMHAIGYVGNNLEGDVGKEFKLMFERLRIGETPDDVFRKACDRFPYSSFQFFIITLRANLNRGGQLKDVINRINRVMFDARAIEKKKLALTSEARMSAKIVGSIPFFFLFFMQYMSPQNYEYVMFNEAGRPILYYMLVSEFIGMFIIWKLMRNAT
jgi:tight adherence protein B